MASRDPRIDAYIAKSADFARPILTHLRETVHAAAPTADETIKWGMPFFMYNGRILCSIAAFKEHCALHFWKGRQLIDPAASRGEKAMGQFGRIRTVADLPSKKILTGYVKRAIDLHAEVAKSPPLKKAAAKAMASPVAASIRSANNQSNR